MAATRGALPNAAKFWNENMRGGDYTFPTAIADIIDNAIQANAELVKVIVDFDKASIAIIDDGDGMSRETFDEAMRVASSTHVYEKDDLGKYGTGMKAASLSQARNLLVATKTQNSNRYSVQILDLQHITEVNDWDRLIILGDHDSIPVTFEPHLPKEHGTAIVWQQLDRMFGGEVVPGESAYAELSKQVEDARQHLGFVFHRYLAGIVKTGKKVRIEINGRAVEPIDPFFLDQGTALAAEETIKYSNGTVDLKGYILPSEKEFSSPQAFKAATAPGKGWTESQGFYVYRNERLISWGGWLGVRSRDEKVKLARIAFFFTSDMDKVMSVNLSRTKVAFSSQMKKDVYAAVRPVVTEAEKRYRNQHQRTTNAENLTALIDATRANATSRRATQPRRLSNREMAALMKSHAAALGLTSQFNAIMDAVREDNPSAAHDMGWD